MKAAEAVLFPAATAFSSIGQSLSSKSGACKKELQVFLLDKKVPQVKV